MKSGLVGRLVERMALGRLGTLGLAPVLAALLIAGCVSPPEGIDFVQGRELDDVPVKSGLDFVESETYVPPLAEGARFRSWRALYRGGGLFQEIGPWYVGAMKNHGWTFTGVVESKGPTYTYAFQKRDEEAVIRVYREYHLGSGSSINMVRAEVHPRGTESFRPEDLEQMKATGVAWAELPADDVEPVEVQTISFTEQSEKSPPPVSSDFLLEEPTDDLDAATAEDEVEKSEEEPIDPGTSETP